MGRKLACLISCLNLKIVGMCQTKDIREIRTIFVCLI